MKQHALGLIALTGLGLSVGCSAPANVTPPPSSGRAIQGLTAEGDVGLIAVDATGKAFKATLDGRAFHLPLATKLAVQVFVTDNLGKVRVLKFPSAVDSLTFASAIPATEGVVDVGQLVPCDCGVAGTPNADTAVTSENNPLAECDTDKDGVVWLSGTARTQADINNAVAMARATENVRAVQSDIRIQADD